MTSFFTLILLALASSGIFAIPLNGNHGNNGNNGNNDNVSTDPPIQTSGLSATELIEAANAGMSFNEKIMAGGDIILNNHISNADPCTVKGCTWPKDHSGVVKISYEMSKTFSRSERRIIEQALDSIETVTCIDFVKRKRIDKLSFQSYSGCYSYVGRQGGKQVVSLGPGCLYKQVIQHELLHALGFNHEHSRSDRDQYVNILFDNIQPGKEHNFLKIATNNLGTPYDYNSVMQYHRYAFSRNRGVLETIVPIDTSVKTLGGASEMSTNDIDRINRLYEC